MDLSQFLQDSPTSWHAAQTIASILKSQGFTNLDETQRWTLEAGGRYFCSRAGAVSAFILSEALAEELICLAAHTDSPALKLKPNPENRASGYTMWGVEVYGGPLLNSWLNRELGLSGRVVREGGQIELVSITDHPMVLPQLAIHLNREQNEGLSLNRQTHLPVLARLGDSGNYLQELIGSDVLSYDLFLHPIEEPKTCGNNQEMLQGYRLDNLASCHQALMALLEQAPAHNRVKMAFFWDHEEVGSQTAEGAGSPMLNEVIERICLGLGLDREDYLRLKRGSSLLSIDMTHALHPNFADKHDDKHAPLLGQGPALKTNAQQRYATCAPTAAIITKAAKQANVNLQHFVGRTDQPCGSTVGPISATRSGIATVDLGIPQLSMHSARELIALSDHAQMIELLKAVMQ